MHLAAGRIDLSLYGARRHGVNDPGGASLDGKNGGDCASHAQVHGR
jgi:hypothetical protein